MLMFNEPHLWADIFRTFAIGLIGLGTGHSLTRFKIYFRVAEVSSEWRNYAAISPSVYGHMLFFHVMLGLYLLLDLSSHIGEPLTFRPFLLIPAYISFYWGNSKIIKFEETRWEWMQMHESEYKEPNGEKHDS